MPSISEVAEDLVVDNDRFKSVLRIPPSTDGYLGTILTIIQEIEKVSHTLETFSSWFMGKFSVIKSNSYNSRNMLERANLVRLTSGNAVLLTIDGEQCLKAQSPEIIICKNFLEAYEGFVEVLLIIEEKKSINKKELYNEWHDRYSNNFYTNRSKTTDYHQFHTIMQYLLSFKVITINTLKNITIEKKKIEQVLKLL